MTDNVLRLLRCLLNGYHQFHAGRYQNSSRRDQVVTAASRHALPIHGNSSTAYSSPSATCKSAAAIVIGASNNKPSR